MKDQINQLSDKIDQDINEAAFKVKDLKKNIWCVKQEFNKINDGKNEWKNLKTEIGNKLQDIADQINQPLECFFCHSKELLCQKCRMRRRTESCSD